MYSKPVWAAGHTYILRISRMASSCYSLYTNHVCQTLLLASRSILPCFSTVTPDFSRHKTTQNKHCLSEAVLPFLLTACSFLRFTTSPASFMKPPLIHVPDRWLHPSVNVHGICQQLCYDVYSSVYVHSLTRLLSCKLCGHVNWILFMFGCFTSSMSQVEGTQLYIFVLHCGSCFRLLPTCFWAHSP